jgi:hypothetical protein
MSTYDTERRPACLRATQISVTNPSRLRDDSASSDIDAPTEDGERARHHVGARLLEANEKSWQPPGAHLGHIYSPSPIVIPDGTSKPADDDYCYIPSAFPGARAPHFWIGSGRSVIDLFGSGFTLLVFDNSDVHPLEIAASRRALPFQVCRLQNSGAAALYEMTLVLVRPDGHVAWRANALPQECLALIDTVRGAGLNAAARRHTPNGMNQWMNDQERKRHAKIV